MANLPRIFVGTMYSQEGGFDVALERIQQQEGIKLTHFIVAGLREKDAHNALWASWRESKGTHDVFVKVDADTVLQSKQTLLRIAEQFKRDPRVTGMQAPLYDYMTDGLINGLNAFSPRVVFHDTVDEVWCDRQVDTGHELVLRASDLPPVLCPAGTHCYNATDRQAFHYGLHRMLKNQRGTINKVYAAWHRDRDRVRAFAMFGAQLASRFQSHQRVSYDDAEFTAAYDETCKRHDEFAELLASCQLEKIA